MHRLKMAFTQNSLIRDCIRKLGDDFEVKPKQLEAIKSILKGRDTLAILPSGYGESMIYQLLPSIFLKLPDKQKNPIFVVISPLKI